jgi:hypothetical protein
MLNPLHAWSGRDDAGARKIYLKLMRVVLLFLQATHSGHD